MILIKNRRQSNSNKMRIWKSRNLTIQPKMRMTTTTKAKTMTTRTRTMTTRTRTRTCAKTDKAKPYNNPNKKTMMNEKK